MRLLKVLLWTTLTAAVAGCVLALFLRTPAGMRRVGEWVERVAVADNGFGIELHGLTGRLPSQIRVPRVVLRDPQGPWLVAEDVRMEVAPWWLLIGRIQVDRASVARIEFLRGPDFLPGDGRPPRERWLPLLVVESIETGELVVPDSWLGDWLTGPLRVRGDGTLALGTLAVQAAFDVRAATVDALFARGSALSATGIRLRTGLSGNVRTPRVALHAEIERPQLGPLDATSLVADLAAEPAQLGTYTGAQLRLHCTLREPRSGSLADALLGAQASVSAAATVGPDHASVEIESADLQAERISASASGTLADSSLKVDVFTVTLPDLTGWEPLTGGRLDARGSFGFSPSAAELSGQITASASSLAWADPASAWTAGSEWVRVEAAFTYDTATEQLALPSITLAAAPGEVRGVLNVGRNGARLGGQFEMGVPSLAAWPGAERLGLTGTARARVRLAGSSVEPEVVADVSLPGLVVAGGALGDVEGRLELRGTRSSPNGRIELRGDLPAGPLRAFASFTVGESSVGVTGLRVTAPAASASGDLSLERDRRRVSGGIRAQVGDLSVLAPWIGPEAAGRVLVRAMAATSGGQQSVDLGLEAGALRVPARGRWPGLTAEHLEGRVTLPDLGGRYGGTLDLEGEGLASGVLALGRVALEASGDAKGWSGRVTARGAYRAPLEIEAAVRSAPEARGWRVTMVEAKGLVMDQSFALARPALARLAPGEAAVEGFDLRIGDGRVSGSLAHVRDALTADLVLADVPVGLVALIAPSLQITGTLAGRLSVAGTSEGPRVDLALTAEGLRPARWKGSVAPPPFSARLEGSLASADGRLQMVLQDQRTTSFALQASGGLAAVLGRSGSAVTGLPAEGSAAPARISARGSADLAALDALVDLDENRVQGTLTADMTLLISRSGPELEGEVVLTGGSLENPVVGMLLQDGSLRLVGAGKRLELIELSASDGAGGRVVGTGHVDLGAGIEQASYRLAATLDRLWAIRSDEVRLQTGGALVLEGAVGHPRLSGSLETTAVELRPAHRLPPSVVDLEVTEINGVQGSDGSPARRQPASRVPIDLDLAVKIPGRAFFRTVDLDSEWEGKLRLTGASQAPVLTGRLSLVRGSFNALGVPFRVVRGVLRFDEREEIDPDIDVLAEARRYDIVAQLSVAGTASAPRVTLSSEPPLPTDEIAAHLLFGRDATDLTAAQSVQLAAAVARFTTSTVPDPLGWVRRTLRLDRVSVQSDEKQPGSTVVSVGKYVGRGVFVSLDQGTAEATSRARVEAEVTRHFNVATEVGSDSESRLGVNWRYRY